MQAPQSAHATNLFKLWKLNTVVTIKFNLFKIAVPAWKTDGCQSQCCAHWLFRQVLQLMHATHFFKLWKLNTVVTIKFNLCKIALQSAHATHFFKFQAGAAISTCNPFLQIMKIKHSINPKIQPVPMLSICTCYFLVCIGAHHLSAWNVRVHTMWMYNVSGHQVTIYLH